MYLAPSLSCVSFDGIVLLCTHLIQFVNNVGWEVELSRPYVSPKMSSNCCGSPGASHEKCALSAFNGVTNVAGVVLHQNKGNYSIIFAVPRATVVSSTDIC